MKKSIFSGVLFIFILYFLPLAAQVKKTDQNILANKNRINKNLNDWHRAAAETNFDEYFALMTDDAVFIGTDATENWQVDKFKEFSKPYFDAGKAWDFKVVERNIYLKDNRRMAWFDELLDTHMGICRGSGVMMKENNKWKIQHYVLSIEIPNENVDEVTLLKKDFDQELLLQLKKN